MDRHWSEPLDIDTVAARAGYSRYHFVRAFRATYGETPGQYLGRRRIERARDLLRNANLTVTEICLLVGFTSLGTFCTRFKQQVGTTPTEFRRACRDASPAIPGCFVLLLAGGFDPARQQDNATGHPAQFSRSHDRHPPNSVQEQGSTGTAERADHRLEKP